MAKANNTKTKNFIVALVLGASVGAFGILTGSLVKDAFSAEHDPSLVEKGCDLPDSNGVVSCYGKDHFNNQWSFFAHKNTDGQWVCTDVYPTAGAPRIQCPFTPFGGEQ